MKKLFFYFYIYVVLAMVVLQFAFNPVVEHYVEKYLGQQLNQYFRELVKGTFYLLIEDLRHYPEQSWQDRINTLQPRFAEPIALSSYREMKFSDDELKQILEGRIIVQNEGDLFHQKLKNSDYVLTLGPFPEFNPKMLPFNVLIWASMIIILGILALLWALPFWQKLRKLSTAAEAFGNGDFSARASIPQRSSLADLADAFNSMADRIQLLINSHKELTSAVSHELRTPISRMRFGLEMHETASEASERRRYLTEIRRDVDELDTLVATLLTHARLDRITPDLLLKEHAIVPWLGHVFQKAEPRETPLHYQLEIRLESEDMLARFEPTFMEHAVTNLVQNAARYATEQVDLILEQNGNNCMIHVDDDGPGIPEQDRKRIFEPFIRLDSSRSRDSGGIGLGLAIVNRVMTWHGGQVKISDSPLGGARFTIQWPGCGPAAVDG